MPAMTLLTKHIDDLLNKRPNITMQRCESGFSASNRSRCFRAYKNVKEYFKNTYINQKQQHKPMFFQGKNLRTCLERAIISVTERKGEEE